MNFLIILLILTISLSDKVLVPIACKDRKDVAAIKLTAIGKFGLIRKARKTVPEHFHTGIDIKRPDGNYDHSPVYPLAKGNVISCRADGPFASVIIEHNLKNLTFWTVYEHVAGITVHVNDAVDPQKPIARFMNKAELNKYGWQFDHFHLEVLKVKPKPVKPAKDLPERLFNAYTLICFTPDDVDKYYFEPMTFMKQQISR